MNREKQIKEYFKSFRYRWLSEKIREYKDYNIQGLSEEIEKLLSDLTEEKQVYKLKYLTLFFLNTSLYTKSYSEEMMKEIGKLLLSESEIEEGIRFVLKGYDDIIVILWKKALESLMDTDIFKDTSKELSFLFGEYMGEIKQVNLNMH